ncbi:MAG: glycerate kinase [Cyanobacteria bacterium P01_D01_bin.105]
MNQTLSSAAEPICPLIVNWAQQDSLSAAQKQQIIAWEEIYLTGIWCLPSQLPTVIESRAALLQKVVQAIESAPNRPLPLPGNWSEWITLLWTLWLPLAQQLDRQQRALGRPLIQGVLGGQGTGKTTLSKMLQLILAQLGHEMVPLSIDDLYLTYAERQALLTTDERFIWRGPPGTHDIALGIETLKAIHSAAAGETVKIPQFEKSLHGGQGDRTVPAEQTAPTIVLFEGWFVGTRPLMADAFEPTNPLPEPLKTPQDRQFAKACNERLAQYLPLWDFLDSLMVLCPKDYRLSQQWRQEAEHKMKAAGKSGLSDEEITDFVTYFWKSLHPELFITPLTHSAETSLVVYIGSDHSVSELKRPASGHPEPINSV